MSDRAQRILQKLLKENKEVVKTSLLSLVPNSYSLDRYLKELLDNGLINMREEKIVRRTYYISLTEKGRQVAEQLLKAEQIANSPSVEVVPKPDLDLTMTEEEAEMAKHLNLLFHINVMDDHITVEEVKPGKPPRIFNIYVKRNGNGEFRLWCEHDDSYDCWHVKAAWTYPHVQKMMMHYKEKAKICFNCHTSNDSDAIYCKKCGVKLE
ncbi:hypothetical protein ACNF40_06615 [Cuniculiplasma sp. SKW4]|uniref:hypothetical protein n=1 Tax=Cuniculiplasma sp. SKW4 TaxID=3400171 RepID=UPI003FD00B97